MTSVRKTMHSDGENSIEPGLLTLGLNIWRATDTEAIHDRQSYLRTALRVENAVVSEVLNSLIDLIDYKQLRKRDESLIRMEKRLETNKRHLNTLADLERLYRDIHRVQDANRMRERMEEILNNPEFVKEKALCLLEQGYALLFEESGDFDSTSFQKLQDVYTSLQSEIENADVLRKDILLQTRRYTGFACRALSCAMESQRNEAKLERVIQCVAKFTDGLRTLEEISYPEDLLLIWKYYLARAYSQSDGSSITGENRKMAIRIFWQVIQRQTDPKFKSDHDLYIARSYAYVGYIIRRETYDKPDDFRDVVENDTNLQDLFDNQDLAFQRALEIRDDDESVLNRYGRSLWIMTWGIKDRRAKRDKLLEAYDQISKAIRRGNGSNWFAYSTRMRISNALEEVNTDVEERKKYLETARDDGIKSFHTCCAPDDMAVLAKICQKLAKFPAGHWQYGPEHVKDDSYIHEAINYLNVALQLRGLTNQNTCFTLGSCFYEIREMRPAIELMKKAMFLSHNQSALFFSCLCRYLLYFHSETKSLKSGQGSALLQELFYVIQEGRTKYAENKSLVHGALKKIAEEVSLEDYKLFLEANRNYTDVSDQLNEFRDVFWCRQNLPNSRESRTEQQNQAYIPLVPFARTETEAISKSYKYDFCLGHSDHDAGWVYSFLLQQLENKLHLNDIAYTGYLKIRDSSGRPNDHFEAMEKSFKIFIVLSPQFIEEEWAGYETPLKWLTERRNKPCVVPIIIRQCEIPKMLENLDHVDLSNKTELKYEMSKLKYFLLPEL